MFGHDGSLIGARIAVAVNKNPKRDSSVNVNRGMLVGTPLNLAEEKSQISLKEGKLRLN